MSVGLQKSVVAMEPLLRLTRTSRKGISLAENSNVNLMEGWKALQKDTKECKSRKL